jgi:hypothetical protein
MFHQQRNVAFPLPERRQPDREQVEAKIKILAKSAVSPLPALRSR